MLGTWPVEHKARQLKIALGDMISGHRAACVRAAGSSPAAKSDHPRITAIARGRWMDTSLLEDTAEMGFTAVDATELSSAHPNQDLLRDFAVIYLADIAREAIVLQDRNELKKSEALLREALDKYRGLLEETGDRAIRAHAGGAEIRDEHGQPQIPPRKLAPAEQRA